MADELFAVVGSGQVKIRIDQRYRWRKWRRRIVTWKREDHRVDDPHPLKTTNRRESGGSGACWRPLIAGRRNL